jgi:D-3-phosphoglycerate dehydrogenase / 2-oxoglutarate reductase
MNIVGLLQGNTFRQSLSNKLREYDLEINYVDADKSIIPQLASAQIVVNGFHTIDRSVIESCPDLKLVQQSGIGVDNIDIKYCSSKGIYVANVPLANAISVAEHALFLIFLLSKNISLGARHSSPAVSLLHTRSKTAAGVELRGKTLAIIGLGVTGIEVAKIARGLGMRVEAVTKHPTTKSQGYDKKYFVDDLTGVERLPEVLARADVVSIHTPLTEETKDMFGEKEFGVMKKSAYLINVARAKIVNKDALFNALNAQKITGAAFDVYWKEPPDPEDQLLSLENFMLTPHIAGWTAEAIETITRIISINIERMSRGEAPLTVVNKELLI